MRDLDRVRDKIEIRLEPRQVVLLAVGTMVFSGLLFAAGFMLGRRQAPPPVASTTVLAAADDAAAVAADDTPPIRAAAIGEVTFQFPSMLGSRPGRSAPARRPMRLEADVVPRPVKANEAEKIAKPASKPEPSTPVAQPKPEPKPTPAPVEPAPIPPPAPVAVKPIPAPTPAARPALDEDDPDAGAAAPPVAAPVKPVAAPEPPKPVAPKPAAANARYTLQVKAVRDKAEADAFMAQLRRAGFEPHTVLADIPGKGRFYRIRVGRFDSMAAARAFQRRYKTRSGQPDGGFVTDL